MKKIIIITIAIIIVLGGIWFWWQSQENGSEKNDIEKPIQNDEVTNDESGNFLELSIEDRFELIRFILEHDSFTTTYYDNPQEIAMSRIAFAFLDWSRNPEISQEQRETILENYIDAEDWYQLEGYGELTHYIPFYDLKLYFEKMTQEEAPAPNDDICMRYIKEYDFYVLTCGHGLLVGCVNCLTFVSEGDLGTMPYVSNVQIIDDNTYVFEVMHYQLQQEHLYLESVDLLTLFIQGDINETEAKIKYQNTSYFLMHKEDEQWQFKAHSQTRFE